MATYIVKLEDYYFEWGTITDAPLTFGMSLREFQEYYLEEYGRSGYKKLAGRLKRVEEHGTSSRMGYTPTRLLTHNRAGPERSRLTVDEILQVYCLRQPLVRWGGWLPATVEEVEEEDVLQDTEGVELTPMGWDGERDIG